MAAITQLPIVKHTAWQQQWQALQARADQVIAASPQLQQWDESSAVRMLQQCLPEEAQIFWQTAMRSVSLIATAAKLPPLIECMEIGASMGSTALSRPCWDCFPPVKSLPTC